MKHVYTRAIILNDRIMLFKPDGEMLTITGQHPLFKQIQFWDLAKISDKTPLVLSDIQTQDTLIDRIKGFFSKVFRIPIGYNLSIENLELAQQNFAHISETASEVVAVTEDNKIIRNLDRIGPELMGTESHVKAFIEKVKKATLKINGENAVDDLLTFLSKGTFPITSDGCFLAFKRVRDDLRDVYSGTVLNKPGSVIQMDPDLVDPDRAKECSTGLHVATRAYLKNFSGDRLLLIKVDPEDVIAVPIYDVSKMRVSRYEILDEIPEQDAHRVIYQEDMPSSLDPMLQRAILNKYPAPTSRVELSKGQVSFFRLNQVETKEEVEDIPQIIETSYREGTESSYNDKHHQYLQDLKMKLKEETQSKIHAAMYRIYKEFLEADHKDREELAHRLEVMRKQLRKSYKRLIGIEDRTVQVIKIYADRYTP